MYFLKDTFTYSSSYWSNKQSYNPRGGLTAFDDQETKLPTYWSTSFKEICVGMKVGNDLKFVSISYPASSLYSLIADGSYRATNLGRQKWKSLIAGSSLQPHCNREGFNIKKSGREAASVRLGIIGNDILSCVIPDSFIGMGGDISFTYNDCFSSQLAPSTCGNVAGCTADNGDKNTKAMGYILVR